MQQTALCHLTSRTGSSAWTSLRWCVFCFMVLIHLHTCMWSAAKLLVFEPPFMHVVSCKHPQASGRALLSGVLRPSIGNLTALRALNTYNNGPGLGGPLPDSMQQLTQITSIVVSGNAFNGSLPAWAPKLKHLQYLYLANNSFTGPIPMVRDCLVSGGAQGWYLGLNQYLGLRVGTWGSGLVLLLPNTSSFYHH